MTPLQNRRYIVKISVFMEREKHICDAVPYYHRLLPYDIVTRYKWYFEYIAARIKVKHPKRRVIIQYIEDKLPTKEEQITKKRNDLLRGKKSRLNSLKKELEIGEKDLFGFKEQELNKKIEKIKADIDDLENGGTNFYYIPNYKNEIKKWI